MELTNNGFVTGVQRTKRSSHLARLSERNSVIHFQRVYKCCLSNSWLSFLCAFLDIGNRAIKECHETLRQQNQVAAIQAQTDLPDLNPNIYEDEEGGGGEGMVERR